MLGCVLTSVWRTTAGCTDVAHAMGQQPEMKQTSERQHGWQQNQQHQEQGQQHMPFLLDSLQGLAQDVGHARTLLDQARTQLQAMDRAQTPSSVAAAAQGEVVDVGACIPVYVRMCLRACMGACESVRLCLCACARVWARVSLRACACVLACVCGRVQVCALVPVCLRACMGACESVRLCLCACVR